MFFNSFAFFAFLILFLGIYALLPRKAQNTWILIASYFFYGCWDFRFLSLIAFSTVIDYAAGLAIEREQETRKRKAWLLLSLCVNLGLLGIFKYLGFFVDSAAALLAPLFPESSLEAGLNIVLPVGISFYTFQTMSYSLDIYRGQLKPTRNFIDFAAFVSFFPQLVAGPIERASHLLPQIQQKRQVNSDDIRMGSFLLFYGLFQKTVVADNLAALADAGFRNPDKGPLTLLAIYAFAFQIFADFDGYSNMARGMARLMGFRLTHNFHAPYFAVSPSEFWKRWHISLSTWLRDYLYIPLGGNRKGPRRTQINLMLTMLLGGLWHGAAWTFVIWGALHGALLMCWPRSQKSQALWVQWLQRILLFHLVCLGWVFFRAESLNEALELLGHLGSRWGELWSPESRMAWKQLFLFSSVPIAYQALQYFRNQVDPARSWPLPARIALYVFFFYAIAIFGVSHAQSFLYFQF